MNDINMEERIAIKDSARSLKKYGSTSSNSKRCESFIKHQVVQSDTLQGLALKYGVTTEQIRRANTLWANDSLFLRKILLIPSPGGPSANGGLESPINALQTTSADSYQSHHINNNNNNNNNQQGETSCSHVDTNEQQLEEENYSDFLVKIDCAIASTKSQVMIAHDNSQFAEDDSIFWRRKSALSRLKQQQKLQHREDRPDTASYNHLVEEDDRASTTSSSNDTTDVPTTSVVMTQGRKVRNSLQRLERQQNDIFEL
uniref:Putative lysm n=1 Tax=Triatoma infestans TaxID=30076 RepID=A0A023F7Z6_TRIIF